MGVPRRVAGLLVLIAPVLCGQEGPSANRRCDMSVHRVTVRLLDRVGTPVPDASILVRRVHRRTLMRGAASLGDGQYTVIADGALADLRPGGEPFDVTFRRKDRLQRVRLIIGMDAAGCHVALKGGRTSIRL
jgi:hypothetical protein